MKHLRWFLILSTLLSSLAFGQAPAIAEADRIVAVVNEEVITLVELRVRLAQVERQLAQQKTPRWQSRSSNA
jgi:peptidyl-prolyl cis-trans isomerase SurA